MGNKVGILSSVFIAGIKRAAKSARTIKRLYLFSFRWNISNSDEINDIGKMFTPSCLAGRICL